MSPASGSRSREERGEEEQEGTRDDGPPAGPGARWLSGNRNEKLERALTALVALSLIGSAMAIGAVHTAALVPVAIVSLVTALVAVPLRETTAPQRGFPAPMLLLLALAAFTALQAVPMPLTWLAKIAPANADIWARSLLPFGERPTWGSISLDPGATLVEALKWLTYACTLFGAATLAARRGTAQVLLLVFVSATLVALVTLGHGMAEAKKIFGIYQPTYPFPSNHIGPLPNPNNLAGYLNLGLISGIGLMLMRRPIVPPWLVGVGVAFDIGATVRAASRGGVAALILGVLLLAALSRGRGVRTGSLRRRTAPLVLAGGTVVFGAGLAIVGGDVWVWRELLNDNLYKLKIVTWCVPLLRQHGLFGVGRGAFESVFAAYRPTVGLHIVFTHPENFIAQWASEWGIPVAAAAMIALAYMYRPTALAIGRSAVVAAGWVAVTVLLAQNLADLGLEIPAVGIAAATVLGALWGDPSRRRARERSAIDRLFSRIGASRVAIAIAAAGVGLSALALTMSFRDVAGQRERLRDRFDVADEDPSQRAPFRAALRDAMRWRPAEHYFPLLGAMAAFRWKDQSPMPWLQHTLERAPVNGRAHALLASVLAARGARKQALLEARLAVEHEPGLAEAVAPLVTSLAKDYDDVLRAVPEGAAGAPVLVIMARSIKDADVRRRADEEALKRDPNLVEARGRLLAELFADVALHAAGKEGAIVCDGVEACLNAIEAHAEAIEASHPQSSLSSVTRARGMIAAGKRAEAELLLSTACARPEGRSECLQQRAQNLSALDDVTKLDGVLKEYLSDSCTTAPVCASAATFVGNVRERRGDLHAATAAYTRAAQEEPTEDRWLKVADTAERAKMNAQALEALQRVASMRGGADTELAARMTRVRQAATQQLMRF